MQNELLHAPVQKLCHVQHVLGRARDFVDPAELLQLLSGFAQHPEDFAVEAQLVDPAGIRIRAVQDLLRSAA